MEKKLESLKEATLIYGLCTSGVPTFSRISSNDGNHAPKISPAPFFDCTFQPPHTNK